MNNNNETQLLLGRIVSRSLESSYRLKIKKLCYNNIIPGLAVILIGDNPASKVYVNNKEKYFTKMQCYSETFRLSKDVEQAEVLKLIEKLNNDRKFHGILVQLPIPDHINESTVFQSIDMNKDVDGFHPLNFGKLFQGKPNFIPCTPNGIVEVLDYYNIDIDRKHVVVIGRSNIVGKPIFALLSQKFNNRNATVTLCHTGTPDLSVFTKQADIIIAAVGKPNLIKGSMIKKGVGLIDVGINRVDDNSDKGYKLVGDIDQDSVTGIAEFLTPVPGGIGPMTITMLLINTVKSALTLIDE